MVKRVILPSEALDDVCKLIRLSSEQLQALDELFSESDSAFPLRASFINQVAEKLNVGLDDARTVVFVCHVLLRHSKAQDDSEFVTDLLNDFREFLENSVPESEQESILGQFDEKRAILESLASPKPAPLRIQKIRRLERGPERYIEDVRTVCQLRPLFEGQENDESIAGLVPTILLEVETAIDDSDSKTFAFSMSVEHLAKLEQVIQRTRDKLDMIREKYGSEFLTSEQPDRAMASEIAVPEWVNKVTDVQPERRLMRLRAAPQTVRARHEFEIDPFTTTFPEFRRQFLDAAKNIGEALKPWQLSEEEYRRCLSKAFELLYESSPHFWRKMCDDVGREHERTDRFTELPVGPITYRLRSPLNVRIAPSVDQQWEFSLDQFRPRFVGKGASIAAAKRDFLSRVHAAFQSLVRRRPFQMDESQRADWNTLKGLIDVESYWSSVPVTLLETGVLSAVTEAGWEVVWLDGERRETIAIEQTPPDFAAFQPNQWFEALVERSPINYDLRKLCYVRPIEPVQAMSEDEFRQWIDGLPNGDDVPESNTEWADL